MFSLRPTSKSTWSYCNHLKRTFALKAVVLDSTIFAPNTSTKTPPNDGENQDKTTGFASPKHKKVIEIEGVTDVLTKYRSRLREKNIFQNTITKSSLNSGDAQLLQQAKKTLEKINDPNADSPIDAELETVLNYIAHRGLKIYVSFFDPMVSSEIKVDDTALLMKALKSKSIPIEIFQSLEVGEVLDTVLLRHKIAPKDLIIFSNQKHILTQSKSKNVTTCRYGNVNKNDTGQTFSNRTTYVAEDGDGIQSVIEENNGVTFL